MFAKLIKNEDACTVELNWYDSHGMREKKSVEVEMPEDGEDINTESVVFTSLLSTYYSHMKTLQGQMAVGNDGFYQANEIYLLLKVAERDAVHIPIYLAAMFGLSKQEVLDLRWSDISLSCNVLTVRNGMQMRMIRLCMAARDFLIKVHTWQKTHYRLSGSDGPEEDGYVCVDVDGSPFDAEELERRLQATIEKIGFRPICFDALRFCSAAMLLEHGYSIPEVWSWLGQENSYFNNLPSNGCQWVEQS